MPRGGRGELQKIAKELRMHSSRLSQIIRGNMHFTPEQGCHLCQYLGLGAEQAAYFILLVQMERAGTKQLRIHYRETIIKMQVEAKELRKRVPKDQEVREEDKALYYSSWYFSGIRLMCGFKPSPTIDEISERFQLSREKVRNILDFLLRTGLCKEVDGQLQMSSRATHLDANSPLAARVHSNWRLKAMQKCEELSSNELMYTCPVSLHSSDFPKIRENLVAIIESTVKTVVQSEPADTLACLNIDWFKF
jgi:uncharacterized protein (TIGR02147 family)